MTIIVPKAYYGTDQPTRVGAPTAAFQVSLSVLDRLPDLELSSASGFGFEMQTTNAMNFVVNYPTRLVQTRSREGAGPNLRLYERVELEIAPFTRNSRFRAPPK